MKLVRGHIDRSPWPAPGYDPTFTEDMKRHLGWVAPDSPEYRTLLRNKLIEEVGELLDADNLGNPHALLDEAADVFEVLRALLVAVYPGVTPSTARQVLANAVDRKLAERGGFFEGRTWTGPERENHPAPAAIQRESAQDGAAVGGDTPNVPGGSQRVVAPGAETAAVAPWDIPEEIIGILDRAAGREHRRAGTVVSTLAEILTAWERLRPVVGADVEDDCPHCSPTHGSPNRCAWGVRVDGKVDGDGQPTRLIVQPTDGSHVAQADADWLYTLMRGHGGRPPVDTQAEAERTWGHPLQYALVGRITIMNSDHMSDGDIRAAAGTAGTSGLPIERYNRCPTCEEWSPCHARPNRPGDRDGSGRLPVTVVEVTG